MSVLDTLNQLRANYGAVMSDDECVDLINHAAWLHRADGYGLSRKDAGTHGVRHDGVACCHDVLMLANGQAWDCLTAAGAQSTPSWSSVGVITDPSRGWVAPIAPKGTGTGPTPPPVVTPPAPSVDLSPVLLKIADLSAQVADLSRVVYSLIDHGVHLTGVDELLELARQNEKRREELAVHVDQVIVERTTGWAFKGNAKLIGAITGRVGE